MSVVTKFESYGKVITFRVYKIVTSGASKKKKKKKERKKERKKKERNKIIR